MTVFIHTNKQNPIIEGTLDDANIQFHKYLVIDAITDDEIYKSGTNQIQDVEVGEFKKGKKLISGVFGPCNAVAMKLRSDEWVLYHAKSGHTGVLGVSADAKNLQNFLNTHKNEIQEIYVFEKSNPAVNAIKSPLVAIALSNFVNPDVEIKRLNVEDHRYVMCDSEHNKILLFDELKTVENIQAEKQNPELAVNGQKVDLSTSISLPDTITQVVNNRSEKPMKDSSGNFNYQDSLKIPSRFSSFVEPQKKNEYVPK